MMCFDPTHLDLDTIRYINQILDLDTIQIQNLVIGSSSDTIQIRSNAQVTSFIDDINVGDSNGYHFLANPPLQKKRY